MTTIEIFTKQRADVPALEIDDADLLDPDVTIDMPAPLRSGTIRVRLEYAGPGEPLPIEIDKDIRNNDISLE